MVGVVAAQAANRIAVDAHHAGTREEPRRLRFDSLRACAEVVERSVAFRASLDRAHLKAAAVAQQSLLVLVIDQRNVAMGAIDRAGAISADDDGRHPPPVEEDDGLLRALQRDADQRLQRRRDERGTGRFHLMPHVDDVDLGHGEKAIALVRIDSAGREPDPLRQRDELERIAW